MPSPINIFAGLAPYHRVYHAIHLAILRCLAQVLVICAGRRFGKTFTGSLWFLDRFLELLAARAEDVAAGREKPWSGLGLPRARARRRLRGVVVALVVAPTQKHLEEIQGLIEERLSDAGAEELLHPDPRMASVTRPQRENWFLYKGAAGVIRYLVGSRPDQIRGSKVALLWLDEAGFLDEAVWTACKPMVWEHRARTLLTGTPAFSDGHFFTKLAVSGLPPDHERADARVAKPRPDVTTFLASSEQAYSEVAREEVAKDLAVSGADSLYVLQEVKADWRLPSLYVFPWHAPTHLATVRRDRGRWVIETSRGPMVLTDNPTVWGGIDWFRGTAPGGAVLLATWPVHPLSLDDKRWLTAVIAERPTRKGESDEDFINALLALQRKHAVAGWYSDPSSENKQRLAEKLGLVMQTTSNKDKEGRVGLVQRQLHYTADLPPALYVDPSCKVTADQLQGFRRARDKKGQPTEKFVNYNDAHVDALAYVVPSIGSSGVVGGGFGG